MFAFDESIVSVRRPGRYIGKEWNAVVKPPSSSTIRVALCYPDVYEIGMSYIGLRILYEVLNRIPDVACERVFAPWPDMEAFLRARSQPLFTLETRTPLGECDLVCFSLNYEMSYSNILTMLDLAGIPFSSAERSAKRSPVVIGGGSSAVNPEPVSAFFDAFLIGEGEEAITEIVACYREHRLGRERFLEELVRIPGIYVPSFYTADNDTAHRPGPVVPAVKHAPARIVKRIVGDLENAPYPERWLVPYLQIVHDRISIEVMRGCPNDCAFCQARNIYYPFRVRSADRVMEIARRCYETTGYEEVSFVSLSTGQHPGIDRIVELSEAYFAPRCVSLSLPSLRLIKDVERFPSLISSIKKTGLTFAPEAGTERLRAVINKRLDTDDLFRTLDEAQRSGYRRVKLYFMIGLPTETDEDVDGIIRMLKEIAYRYRSIETAVSVANFIPKPHTRFEREAMASVDELRRKQARLRSARLPRRIQFKFHDPRLSFWEAVFSRGSRALSGVIEDAWRRGARFDAWTDLFDPARWEAACAACGVEPQAFCLKSYGPDEALPWDHIDLGCRQKVPPRAL